MWLPVQLGVDTFFHSGEAEEKKKKMEEDKKQMELERLRKEQEDQVPLLSLSPSRVFSSLLLL